jgi:hypothetical protein
VELIGRMLEPMVTAVFDSIPDLIPTAPAFDVTRGLWVIAVINVVFSPY